MSALGIVSGQHFLTLCAVQGLSACRDSWHQNRRPVRYIMQKHCSCSEGGCMGKMVKLCVLCFAG